jgi:hypothetical protein
MPAALFMGRHFNWQPSECEAIPCEELFEAYREGVAFLEREREAMRR